MNGVSFDLRHGEVLCIIGKSGSGKSVTLRALMSLLPKRRTRITGRMRVGDHDILALTERQLAEMRGSVVSMIFQEPMTALDPVYTIGHQIAETVRASRGHLVARRARPRARAAAIGQGAIARAAPAILSARAFGRAAAARDDRHRAVLPPALLLADEPTTALDATVQIQVLVLLRKLQREFGMGLIFVTHDLGVAAQIADQVAVMYAGRIVEYGSARDVLMNPRHPYTIGMLASTVHGADARQGYRGHPRQPARSSCPAAGLQLCRPLQIRRSRL